MKRNRKKQGISKPQRTPDQSLSSESTVQESKNRTESWTDNEKKVRKEFPGPKETIVQLRIAFNKKVYSEITEHVHKFFDIEVCGVLVGDFCEDENGSFVHVQHMIEGSAAQQGNAHVTFTQDTWNIIHERLDRDFRNKRIVGWYHSHPGFGVTFSDMDLFIQKNFFSLPTQFALVIDPLGGDAAICINGSDKPVYIDRFWIEGKEKNLFIPHSHSLSQAENNNVSVDYYKQYLNSLELRVNQVLQVLDFQSRSNNQIILILVLVIGTVLSLCIGYTIFNSNKYMQPPELLQYIPLPVKIGEDTALVGINVVKWNIPSQVLAKQFDLQEKEIAFIEKKLREEILNQIQTEHKKEGFWTRFTVFFTKPFSAKKKEK